MSSKRTFYKTTIKLVILSEDAPPEWESLSDLASLMEEGPCSGDLDVLSQRPITGRQAARELRKQRSEPEFFMLDDNGNDIDKTEDADEL